MQEFRKKLNELSKIKKILIRLVYPILLYTIIHFLVIQHYPRQEQTIQLVFIFIWAALEWYFFLAVNMKKHRDQ